MKNFMYSIGKKAIIGAGSTLTKSVKDKSLSLGRANQIEIRNESLHSRHNQK